MITRRKFLTSAGVLAGSAAVLQKLGSAQEVKTREPDKSRETTAAANGNKPLIERVDPKPTLPPGEAGKDYTPVITPNNVSLPWKIIDGVKVYHLVAEEVGHEFAPGMRAKCWGFNGHVHGPTIEAVEGDRVRIYVTNNLPGHGTDGGKAGRSHSHSHRQRRGDGASSDPPARLSFPNNRNRRRPNSRVRAAG